MSRRLHLAPALRLACCVSFSWLAACSTGRFVWIDDYVDPPASEDTTYVIRTFDVLNLMVWNQSALTTRVKVRADGKVSVPLLNDVDAAGLTPSVLAKKIQEKLRGLVNNAVVTVSVEEATPLMVAVLGEVKEPGMKQLEPGSGLLQALAMGGGFTDYARDDLLFVLRPPPPGQEGVPTRIRFTYRALIRTEGRAAAFQLRSRDVVVVE
jgi:polysaccharide export outer membrane protein